MQWLSYSERGNKRSVRRRVEGYMRTVKLLCHYLSKQHSSRAYTDSQPPGKIMFGLYN